MQKLTVFFVLIFFFTMGTGFSQKKDNTAIKEMIEAYKKDIRGPYKDLRWFCPDGSTVPANERCPEPGGLQHGRLKDAAVSLQKTNHIFLGQILSTTPYSDFWDAEFNHSRLKQYLLERYLRVNDNGWIMRKAQFYRGAIQSEDEEEWGLRFFEWLLKDETVVTNDYFLIRQAAKNIPHKGDDNLAQNIRGISKNISDTDASFINIRIKIHGQPEKEDLQQVKDFKTNQNSILSPEIVALLDELISDMEILYQPVNLKDLNKYLKYLPSESELKKTITRFINTNESTDPGPEKLKAICEMLFKIRMDFQTVKNSSGRLAMLDLSNALEDIIFREIGAWETSTLDELLEKIYALTMGATGAGYLELWEWNEVSNHLEVPTTREMYFYELNNWFDNARRTVEWSSGMARAHFSEVLTAYNGFEPLTNGFLDDRIRSSLLLSLGRNVGFLGDFIAQKALLSNKVIGVSDQNNIRGLNPGYAFGELVVHPDAEEEVVTHSDKIYIFNHPPADLKPVAGIATVSEGNMVSHVQLLARNLGIPNAVISLENMNELKEYSGKQVFYAVSNRGTVIIKEADKMTPQEKRLISVRARNEDRVEIPVDQIILKEEIINLRDVTSKDSGKRCGPKAANLGQLKHMFPDHVVEGIVIPFGIFKEHMDLQMPGKGMTYWEFLNQTFISSNEMLNDGIKEPDVEKYVLDQLAILRGAISTIQLTADFNEALKEAFKTAFGKDMGKVPVFLRSDTNMEDLKDFTGAGLNLTLFNVVDQDKIIQGIKDVWASPYTERSYKWRQKYLLNPENVYPSILIIPSVDVDYSGVMITKGIQSGNLNDITVAFSRGAGGAVEGQAAETYMLTEAGANMLLAPAREMYYNSLPLTGGTKRNFTSFEKPILNKSNLDELRNFAAELKTGMSSIQIQGPYDVELGFKSDKLWLFQVRPFVENKRADSSAYLESISPNLPTDKKVTLKSKL